MNQDKLDRLRRARFAEVRRGYDTREVDKFVADLVAWLESDAAEELGSTAVQRKLEAVGKTTSQILLTAEQQAGEMREQATKQTAQAIQAAKTAAAETRRAADEYAAKTREKADADGAAAIAQANAKARGTVEEGMHRRAQLEAVIGDLCTTRDRVIAELDRLGSEVEAAVAAHTPKPGSDPFATPAVPDTSAPARSAPPSGKPVRA